MLTKIYCILCALLTGMLMAACSMKEKTRSEQKSNQPLTVGTNAAYPPYESMNKEGNIEGFDIAVAHAIAKKLHRQLVLKDMSFDALILALQQGKVDMVMAGMSITPERLQAIHMVPYQGEDISSLSLAFWGKIPEGIKTIEDLQQYIQSSETSDVCVLVGTWMEQYLALQVGIQPKSLEMATDLVMDIKYGKSVAALFEPPIFHAMRKNFPELHSVDLALPHDEKRRGNGIGIRKDNLALLQQIEKAVQELKESEVLQELEKKWFSESSS